MVFSPAYVLESANPYVVGREGCDRRTGAKVYQQRGLARPPMLVEKRLDVQSGDLLTGLDYAGRLFLGHNEAGGERACIACAVQCSVIRRSYTIAFFPAAAAAVERYISSLSHRIPAQQSLKSHRTSAPAKHYTRASTVFCLPLHILTTSTAASRDFCLPVPTSLSREAKAATEPQ